MLAIVVQGWLLGWSVAWPPGPINAEMMRRGLERGFVAAFAVGLGASSGDFLWALAVALGAGALADVPGVRSGMGIVSLLLLVFLAFTFAKGAWRAWRDHQAGRPPAQRALESARGGYLLGLTMALTSPWNLAFWLAVIGSQGVAQRGLSTSLVLASAVIAGAVSWNLVLGAALQLGARFATPAWHIATRAGTAALMLFFAFRAAVRLAG